MTSRKKGCSFTLKVLKNDREIDRYQTRSKRRFLNRIRTINWRNKPFEVYVRVYYGKEESVDGKIVPFWNDGYYETKKDLMLAVSAFLEEC